MISFYEEQCLETPIKKGHAQSLVDAIDSLRRKHRLLICSSLAAFPGGKANIEVRKRQLDGWLNSERQTRFVLEVFWPAGPKKLCSMLELNNIKHLGTDFGKRNRRKCVAYLSIYSFSESSVPKQEMDTFYKDLRKSMKKFLCLKKPPHMRPIWLINKTFESLRKKAKPTEEPSGIVLTALEMLKDSNLRDVVLRARQAKDPTISNIAKSLGLRVSAVRPLVLRANKKGTLTKEYNIVCGKCRKVLARVPNKQSIGRMAKDNVSCYSCGTPIGRSSFEEVYTVPVKVGELLDGSKWMSLCAWRTLRSLGFAGKNILLEVIHGPNELDVVANFDGKLVLMELTDNRFSIGHAYTFVGKCSQYKPQISVVVSTGGVGPDVREYIKNTGMSPQYVNDINKLNDELNSIFSKLYGLKLAELIRHIFWDSFFSQSLLEKFGLSEVVSHEGFPSFMQRALFRRYPLGFE